MNLSKEEISQIIYSAVSQAGHNKSAIETKEAFLALDRNIDERFIKLDEKFEKRTLTPEELAILKDFVTTMKGATFLGNITKWIVSVMVAIGGLIYFIKQI